MHLGTTKPVCPCAVLLPLFTVLLSSCNARYLGSCLLPDLLPALLLSHSQTKSIQFQLRQGNLSGALETMEDKVDAHIYLSDKLIFL